MNLKIRNSQPEKRDSKILCSVCVATYKRAKYLEALLNSLKNQVLSENVFLEINVVDNDLCKSAEQVLQKFKKNMKISFHYYHQPIKNISITRNLSVKHSSGDYILFIDDDEIASPDWVSHLLNTLNKYNADGVFGLVLPEFHEDAPKWIRYREFFFRPMTATGMESKYTYTTNCLVKTKLLKKLSVPFDPQFGTTGGEDTKLFGDLIMKGARFVNCREAVTYEFIPLHRTKLVYLLKRALQGGNSYTRRVLEVTCNYPVINRIVMFLKGFGNVMVSLIFILILFPITVNRTRWMIKLSANIGRLLAVFNWHYHAYK